MGRRFVCPLLDRGKREDTLNQSLCILAYTSRTIPQRGGRQRAEGPQELGDRRIAFQHQQHISQQNVSPPSHFAFTTDRPHFTDFFVVVFFLNPLGHVDKLESKQTVCGGESPLIGAPPLFETLLCVGSHDFLPCVLRLGARMKRRLTEHRLRALRKNGKEIMGSFTQEGKVITARNVPTKRTSNHRIWLVEGEKCFYCLTSTVHPLNATVRWGGGASYGLH